MQVHCTAQLSFFSPLNVYEVKISKNIEKMVKFAVNISLTKLICYLVITQKLMLLET